MINQYGLKFFNFLTNKISTKRKLFLTTSLNYIDRKFEFADKVFDYVRYSTLELISYEIQSKKVEGSVAELGVYKGEFAKYINKCFPEKKFYLFDTFSGFDARDIKNELKNNFSVSNANKEFANTNVEMVLSKMEFPENIVVKKGFFPETAKGIDDKFCFVSLDADLYDPIYYGLHFFYPKLSCKGYILVHDYNNTKYKGARRALEDFCNENKLSYVPIPDTAGTAILTK